MNDDFVTFELAKKLKEKGYPQHQCDYEYITEDDEYEEHYVIGDREYIPFIPDYLPTIASPTIYQVLTWLRKEKEIDIVIYPIDACTLYMGGEKYILSVYIRRKRDYKLHHDYKDKYVEWEDAAIAGIYYILDKLDELI